MPQRHSNNSVSTLAADISASATVLNVQPGHGARFPAPAAGEWFWITVQSGATVEIMRCTSRAVDALTVVRGQDGTTGVAWTAGASVEARLTAGVLDSFVQKDALAVAVTKTTVGQVPAVNGFLNATLRWQIRLGDSTTESGSNSGSNFGISRYNDAGALIDTPFSIDRATGVVSANGAPVGPRPSGAPGIGHFYQAGSATGADLVLPAGGRWQYFFFNFTSANLFTGTCIAGVGVGGSTLVGGVAGFYWTGFVMRTE